MTETLIEPQIEIETPTIEYRSKKEGVVVADVNFPKRIVTVITMPYEQPTVIYGENSMYTEVCSRGAFNGTERRTNQIKANRDHDWDKPIGRIVAVHPSRSEGLVTEIKISNTVLGTESLELTADDVLGASAGFGLLRHDGANGPGTGPVWEDAEIWERNGAGVVRRLNRLFLDHVALVPNPAYPGAVKLDVRSAAVSPQEAAGRDATPNRDSLTAEELRAQSDALNARWSRRVTVDVRILPGE